MSRMYRLLLIAALALLAACGDSPPEGLAIAESTDEETTTTVVSDDATVDPVASDIVSQPTTSDVSNEAVVVETTVPPSSTTTTTITTTAPTTTSTTIWIPDPSTCSGDRHEVNIPDGWVHTDCDVFTSGVFPSEGADIEFRAEIDFAFTTSETYAQSLARINSTEVVYSSTATTIDGLAAHEFVLEDNGWFMDGERTVVVVNTGDGVFFGVVNQVIDIQGPLQGGDLDSHYAYTSAIFDDMLSTISIDGTPSPCVAPSLANVVELATGSDDVDNDGVNETVSMMRSDSGDYLQVEGLASGTAWGYVEAHVVGLPLLGWMDWNSDGTPELFTPGDGGASGVRSNIYTIDGCAIVPVVDTDGIPASLWSRASGLSANSFSCEFDAQGDLSSFNTTVTTIDGDTGDSTNETTSFTYANGVLTEIATPQTGEISTSADGTFGGCAIALN